MSSPYHQRWLCLISSPGETLTKRSTTTHQKHSCAAWLRGSLLKIDSFFSSSCSRKTVLLANFRRALVERIVADADELLQARLLHHGRPIPDGPQGNPRPRNPRPQVPVKARPANSTLQRVGIKAPPPHVLPRPPSKARPSERASSRSRSRSRTN